LAIVEGPIVAVIAGFLCTGGYLNPFIVFPIIIVGDIIGDSICYLFGRWGVPNFVKKISRFFGLTPEKIEQVRAYYELHPKRTISLSKIALGIGVAGIYLAGNSKVPYSKFIKICLATSALQYVFYLGIGLLFGDAYTQINNYLNVFASITIILSFALVMFLITKSLLKKI